MACAARQSLSGDRGGSRRAHGDRLGGVRGTRVFSRESAGRRRLQTRRPADARVLDAGVSAAARAKSERGAVMCRAWLAVAIVIALGSARTVQGIDATSIDDPVLEARYLSLTHE